MLIVLHVFLLSISQRLKTMVLMLCEHNSYMSDQNELIDEQLHLDRHLPSIMRMRDKQREEESVDTPMLILDFPSVKFRW